MSQNFFIMRKGLNVVAMINPVKGVYGVQVPVGVWHTLVVHEPSVIIEMKDGAYVSITMDDIWQYE